MDLFIYFSLTNCFQRKQFNSRAYGAIHASFACNSRFCSKTIHPNTVGNSRKLCLQFTFSSSADSLGRRGYYYIDFQFLQVGTAIFLMKNPNICSCFTRLPKLNMTNICLFISKKRSNPAIFPKNANKNPNTRKKSERRSKRGFYPSSALPLTNLPLGKPCAYKREGPRIPIE